MNLETDMPDASRITPNGIARWLGQIVLYGCFAAFIGTFSHWPPYQALAADQAVIKISVTHVGKPVGECRRLSQEELDKLPPNMRFPEQCPRERSPLSMAVELDGRSVLERVAPATGVHRDSAASIYERINVPVGEHRIAVRLNDDVKPGAESYEREAVVDLRPGQVLVIDFDATKGGITLQ